MYINRYVCPITAADIAASLSLAIGAGVIYLAAAAKCICRGVLGSRADLSLVVLLKFHYKRRLGLPHRLQERPCLVIRHVTIRTATGVHRLGHQL